jgi:ubiquinone biosynthesis protein
MSDVTGEDGLETAEIITAIRAWISSVQLVPEGLAEYAALVTDGLLFFLERLPASRLAAIVGDQLAMNEDASPDDRLVALLRRCPTLHKLGQVVSHESGLPAELRVRLQRLESMAPAPGNGDIERMVERELGTVAGLAIAPEALAEGSVAFIVPFAWTDAPAGLPRRGVFKALKPDAEAHLLEDLAIWPALGDYLEERSAYYGLASLEFRSTLDGVANLLLNEIRLDREQERLDWARQFYADSPRVVVPQLLPLCTPRLTAMERIDGWKVTDSPANVATRRSLARTLVEALLAKPFWSPPAAAAVFHADPHAGNLLATSDERVAILDWALTTRLNEAQLAAVVQTLLGAATLDESLVLRALSGLGEVKNARTLRAMVARGLADVRRGVFPGFEWLTPLLDGLARTASVTFPEETALFRKSLLTLRGVVRDVSPHTSVDEILIRDGGREFLGESPLRALAPFESRAFGTHVSNADLLRFVSSAPWTPARYMLGAYAEYLAAFANGARRPPG